VDCANCGIDICLKPGTYERRRKDGRDFYCPNGHSNHYPPEPTKDQKRIAELEQQNADLKRLRERLMRDHDEIWAAREELIGALKECPGGCGWRSRRQIPRSGADRMQRGIERVKEDVAMHLVARHGARAERAKEREAAS
jgi:hypothetical protein